MQVNNLIDLEKVILEESPKYPGFYIHPDNKLLSFSITDRDKKEIILADGLKNLIPYSKKSTSRLCEYFKKHSILDCGRYLIKKL
jgi:hypothetical protein